MSRRLRGEAKARTDERSSASNGGGALKKREGILPGVLHAASLRSQVQEEEVGGEGVWGGWGACQVLHWIFLDEMEEADEL
jgi:hypothetical protein